METEKDTPPKKPKSLPLKNKQNYTVLAEKTVGHMIELEELETAQTSEIDAIQENYSDRINPLKLVIKKLKARLSKFAREKSPLLFEGEEKGSLITNRSCTQVKKNPASVVLIDKNADMEELILNAKKIGFGNVIKLEEVFSIKMLHDLDNETLARLGWKKIEDSKKFTLSLAADKSIKETERLDAIEED